MKSFTAQTHYEVLEVSVGARGADIDAAYQRLMQLYGEDQVALYGLIDAGSATALRKRLAQAREALIDDDTRDAYDVSIGLPPREVKKPPPPVSAPRPRVLEPSPNYSWVTPIGPAPSAPSANVYTYTAGVPPPEVLPAKGNRRPTLTELPVVAAALEPLPVPVPSIALTIDVEEPAEAPPPLPPPPVPLPVPELVLAPIAHEAPVPRLSDDVGFALIPARATPSREFRVESRPRPYDVPSDVEFNGDLLRQVRMARGISLAQLADRTRIGMKHLENLETDRYDALPAGVYLRGILMNVARELGLDGLRVSKSYMTFVDAHRSKS